VGVESKDFLNYKQRVLICQKFEQENLNCDDYKALTQDWAHQLCQLGYHRAWDSDSGEYGWQAAAGGPVQSTYESWSDATGTPDDLNTRDRKRNRLQQST